MSLLAPPAPWQAHASPCKNQKAILLPKPSLPTYLPDCRAVTARRVSACKCPGFIHRVHAGGKTRKMFSLPNAFTRRRFPFLSARLVHFRNPLERHYSGFAIVLSF